MNKVLVITYYWPPAGGSGVQRWMYFCRYLKDFGITPIVITVDENKASYRYKDYSFNKLVEGIEVHRTNTFELLKLYSRMVSGKKDSAIPIGFAGESNPGIFQKISRYIRGNFFIPDARIGWVKYAYKKAEEIIIKEKIKLVITNGTPHSTHLAGEKIKNKFPEIKWIADFRDPWTELHYNKFLYRTKRSLRRDAMLEKRILNGADMLLTVGPSMKKHLVSKGNISSEKVNYIYNGYDENDFRNTFITKNPDLFIISHIGMLSESQPITVFLNALKIFFDKKHPVCSKIVFRLIGNVSPAITEETKKMLPDMSFESIRYVPKEQAVSYMLESDLLLNSLAEMENSELLISGKLMEYIASGRPILCLGNPSGDAANLLNEFENCGVFDRKNVSPIAVFLETIFDSRINKVTFASNEKKIKQYSRYETTRLLAELIKKYL